MPNPIIWETIAMGLPSDVTEYAPVFDETGSVNVIEISHILGFQGRLDIIAQNSGISVRTLKRPTHSSKTIMALNPMIHLTNLLWAAFDGNKTEISKFIHSPRTEWDGMSPALLLKFGKHQGITDYLERWTSGVEGLGS